MDTGWGEAIAYFLSFSFSEFLAAHLNRKKMRPLCKSSLNTAFKENIGEIRTCEKCSRSFVETEAGFCRID
jgi:hypothetical protein